MDRQSEIPIEPKAGKFGVFCVVVFGLLWILVAFVAAMMWTDAEDLQLAGAISMAALLIPTGLGYFVSEVRHQRSGAVWFVIIAAGLSGFFGAWAIAEQDDFDLRRNLIAPGVEQGIPTNE